MLVQQVNLRSTLGFKKFKKFSVIFGHLGLRISTLSLKTAIKLALLFLSLVAWRADGQADEKTGEWLDVWTETDRDEQTHEWAFVNIEELRY